VIDPRAVAPRNLVACDSEYRGHSIPFRRAWRPSSRYDGQHTFFIKAGTFGKLMNRQAVLFA